MVASTKVTFHENQGFDDIPVARPEPATFSQRLTRMGIAASPADAAIMLAVFATLLIAVNIYLFARAVPEPPALGNDVLRPGEQVPAYVEGGQ